MEDENLLDDDIIVRETQDNSPTTFSRNLVNRLGLSSQQNRTETVSINNNNNSHTVNDEDFKGEILYSFVDFYKF